MKISISTLPFKDWTLEEVIEISKKANYDALEIRMDFHSWSNIDLSDEHYKAVSEKIQNENLKVVGLGSSVVTATYSEEHVKNMRRLFEIANILDAKGVRIMLGYSRNFAHMPIYNIDFKGVNQFMEEIDKLAGEFKKEVWIETHNEYSTGKMVSKLFSEVNLKNTKVIWDVMHSLELNEPIDETLNLIYENITHIHLKDGMPWKDADKLIWKHMKLGEGQLPIKEVVEKLEEKGYKNYYSLEWESSWREELRELNCDEEQIIKFPELIRSIKSN